MKAEITEYDSGRWDENRTQRIERVHDVRSVSVRIAEHDGDRYPRVGIDTPSCSRSIGLRPDGPVAVELFDDLVHDARGSSVCGPDETWLKTTISRETKRLLFDLAQHGTDPDLVTVGDVVREAIDEYLERHDLEACPECDDRATEIWVDRTDEDDVGRVEPCGCVVDPELATAGGDDGE